MLQSDSEKIPQTSGVSSVEVRCIRRPLPLKEAAVLYDWLYDGCSTSSSMSECSKEIRAIAEVAEHGAHERELAPLVYGEVPLLALAHILERCDDLLDEDRRNGVLIDLGSGSGRVVVGASLLRPFRECRGVEVLAGLHEKAAAVLDRLQQARPYTERHCSLQGEAAMTRADAESQRVVVHFADFLEHDWADADLVFANSTCFTPKLMAALEERAKALRPGSVAITLTRQLQSAEDFDCVASGRRTMSWGPAGYYIYRRR